MRILFPVAVLALVAMLAFAADSKDPDEESWTRHFTFEAGELASTGRNPYFILEPGYTLLLESGNEQLTITVLSETQMIDNVETRVVEEREMKDGQLVEVSRNFFAISRRTNSVFYFGEDVDIYKGGKIVRHEGAWRAGVDGAQAGLMMPGLPLLKGRHYQEVAPGVAMDRAEIVSVNDQMTTPAGNFKQVLKVTETTPLEPDDKGSKYYAPGVGLLQDESLKLVKYGKDLK